MGKLDHWFLGAGKGRADYKMAKRNLQRKCQYSIYFPIFYYENFQIYSKGKDFTVNIYMSVHKQDSTINIPLFSICYKSIHLSSSLSTYKSNYYLGDFQSKLKTSRYLPLNTLAHISLTRIQYLFIIFFLLSNIYI